MNEGRIISQAKNGNYRYTFHFDQGPDGWITRLYCFKNYTIKLDK